MDTNKIINELRKEKNSLKKRMQAEINRIEKVIGILGAYSPTGASTMVPTNAPTKKRKMSAAARKKISAAMKARWAKRKAAR
jgi:hypothetical protein